MSQGWNPMQWKCRQLGCYNEKARPKIEVFAECLPGFCAMGDVDGLVELRGFFLILEWKSNRSPIPDGQRIWFDKLARMPGRMFTVLCVAGNAETMRVTHTAYVEPGRLLWVAHDLDYVKRFIHAWGKWAMRGGDRGKQRGVA